MKCPCGIPVTIKHERNIRYNCMVDVSVCLCGRHREVIENDPLRGKFIQKTYKMMKKEVAPLCKSNEVYIDKFKALADSL